MNACTVAKGYELKVTVRISDFAFLLAAKSAGKKSVFGFAERKMEIMKSGL